MVRDSAKCYTSTSFYSLSGQTWRKEFPRRNWNGFPEKDIIRMRDENSLNINLPLLKRQLVRLGRGRLYIAWNICSRDLHRLADDSFQDTPRCVSWHYSSRRDWSNLNTAEPLKWSTCSILTMVNVFKALITLAVKPISFSFAEPKYNVPWLPIQKSLIYMSFLVNVG